LSKINFLKMPYKQHRACPLCSSQTLNLSDHLRKVHGLTTKDRQPYLQMVSQTLQPSGKEDISFKTPLKRRCPWEQSEGKKPAKDFGVNIPDSVKRSRAATSYPEFCFKHPLSMLVVGPTQSGKTHFVEQMLTTPVMDFPPNKDVQVTWFYNQWQPRYNKLKKRLGRQITFEQGLPDWSEDLREINPKIHHLLIFDDLMSQAVDSPILSRLFTQGRHRNASVILLMQNMFPKGKYNTDISRNAQYLVLFRSPSDRKQMDIMAERIFAKDRPKFMQVYSKATQVPYGYVLIDNQPCTAPEYQVVTDVFGTCQRHPILNEQPPMKRICISKKSEPESGPVETEELSDVESEQLEESEQSDPEESVVEDLQEESEQSEDNMELEEDITPEEKKAAIHYLSFSYPERMNIRAKFNGNPEYKRSALFS